MDVGFELVASDVLSQVGCEYFDGIFEGDADDFIVAVEEHSYPIRNRLSIAAGLTVADV